MKTVHYVKSSAAYMKQVFIFSHTASRFVSDGPDWPYRSYMMPVTTNTKKNDISSSVSVYMAA
jgi:hypothetical protein